jgi:hypothetical protein
MQQAEHASIFLHVKKIPRLFELNPMMAARRRAQAAGAQSLTM